MCLTWLQGENYLRDLLAIEPIVVLNAGFCERHMRHCPRGEQLLTECAKVVPPLCPACSRFLSRTPALL